jgi:hypothetical protein
MLTVWGAWRFFEVALHAPIGTSSLAERRQFQEYQAALNSTVDVRSSTIHSGLPYLPGFEAARPRQVLAELPHPPSPSAPTSGSARGRAAGPCSGWSKNRRASPRYRDWKITSEWRRPTRSDQSPLVAPWIQCRIARPASALGALSRSGLVWSGLAGLVGAGVRVAAVSGRSLGGLPAGLWARLIKAGLEDLPLCQRPKGTSLQELS